MLFGDAEWRGIPPAQLGKGYRGVPVLPVGTIPIPVECDSGAAAALGSPCPSGHALSVPVPPCVGVTESGSELCAQQVDAVAGTRLLLTSGLPQEPRGSPEPCLWPGTAGLSLWVALGPLSTPGEGNQHMGRKSPVGTQRRHQWLGVELWTSCTVPWGQTNCEEVQGLMGTLVVGSA